MAAVAADWRTADLDELNRQLCRWAEAVTRGAAATTAEELDQLRALGFDDRAIHDATQVIAYFNYINRMADALSVDAEDWLYPWEEAGRGHD